MHFTNLSLVLEAGMLERVNKSCSSKSSTVLHNPISSIRPSFRAMEASRPSIRSRSLFKSIGFDRVSTVVSAATKPQVLGRVITAVCKWSDMVALDKSPRIAALAGCFIHKRALTAISHPNCMTDGRWDVARSFRLRWRRHLASKYVALGIA